MLKLWDKENVYLDKYIEDFTVGDDYLFDQRLVEYDCVGSIAHVKMLHKIGIINSSECKKIEKGLNETERVRRSLQLDSFDSDGI